MSDDEKSAYHADMATLQSPSRRSPVILTPIEETFGWADVISAVELPYVTRPGPAKYIPVRLVEKYILSHYPSKYPDELLDKPPLVCLFPTKAEADVLTRLCADGMDMPEVFTINDPIVNLLEFQVFLQIVKNAYPGIVIPSYKTRRQPEVINSGWVLVQDAMIPYVERKKRLYLPLNVVRGAAQLMLNVNVSTINASVEEAAVLNDSCEKAGLVFSFQPGTALIELAVVGMLNPMCPIQELPKSNPLSRFLPPHMQEELHRVRKTQQLAREEFIPQNEVDPHSITSIVELSPQTINPPPLIPIDAAKEPVPNQSGGLLPNLNVNMTEHNATLVGAEQNRILHDPNDLSQVVNLNTSGTTVSQSGMRTTDAYPSNLQDMSPSTKDAVVVNKITIIPVNCFGKEISCITRGKLKTRYALIESICRVYFSRCGIGEFMQYLEYDLAVKLFTLTKAEESAFIIFFGLQTDKLQCNQLIKLKDFISRMAWLQDRFGPMCQPPISKQNEAHTQPQYIDEEEKLTFEDKSRLSEPGVNGVVYADSPEQVPAGPPYQDDTYQPVNLSKNRPSLEDTVTNRKTEGNLQEHNSCTTESIGPVVKPDGTNSSKSGINTRSVSANKRKASWVPRKCLPSKQPVLDI